LRAIEQGVTTIIDNCHNTPTPEHSDAAVKLSTDRVPGRARLGCGLRTPRRPVPPLGAWQVRAGFDSVRVAKQFSEAVARVDPASGRVLATVNVGSTPVKLQPADGRRLRRYEPTNVSLATTVDLGIDCGQVSATSDLAIAWTYHEDDGESGASAAAFIDPAMNAVVA
jgi:hypothetical protein